MKKWLIFAVIAAMFAVVMFPACGDKGAGDNGGIADNVQVIPLYDNDKTGTPAAYPHTTYLIGYNITWDGVPGYDYYAYYEIMDARGDIQRATRQVKGQTVYSFDREAVDTSAAPALKIPGIKRSEAAGKENWSILACAALGGPDATGITAGAPSGGSGGYCGDVNLTTPDHGQAAATILFTALSTVHKTSPVAKFRIAVVPANPGGFPFEEQRTVKYSGWISADLDETDVAIVAP
jgi:hypothetical protein